MFNSHDCLEGHIILGVVLSIASIVLLCLAAFSTPYITSIYFLSTSTGFKYGAFGYCAPGPGGCSERMIGYDTGREIVEWLTQALILYAIAALLIFLGLWGLVWSLWGPSKNSIWFRIPTALGAFVALLAQIFAFGLFVTARNRFREVGIGASYGAALWLGLAGVVLSFISAFACGPPYTARAMYRVNKNIAYNI